MTDATALIALDWGTSSLRAYRVSARGDVLQTRIVGAGIQKLPQGGFAQAFSAVAADWLRTHPQAVVIASGMVGSRQGWSEVPYAGVPTSLDSLAHALASVEVAVDRQLLLVPGVSCFDAHGSPDVMRGEETQVFGALDETTNALALLPGTHSKWVHVRDAEIVAFSTYLTGELFEILASHSILAAMMTDHIEDEAAFNDGVRNGFGSPGALLRMLFGVRAKALFDQILPSSGRSYLSGLLIGVELADALATHTHTQQRHGRAVVVIGEAGLANTYATALKAVGVAAELGTTDAAPRGMLKIANKAGLL